MVLGQQIKGVCSQCSRTPGKKDIFRPLTEEKLLERILEWEKSFQLSKMAYQQPGTTDNYGLLVLALETNSVFLPAHSRLALASPQHPSSLEASKRPILGE